MFRNFSQDFAVCVKSLWSPFEERSTDIAEWIEMNLALGIKHIRFYVQAVTPKTRALLDYYERSGIIEVVPMQWPGSYPTSNSPWLQKWYYDNIRYIHSAFDHYAYNDCLYTNLYSYKGNSSYGMGGGYDSDGERGMIGQSLEAFADKAVRRGFIRKVYGILSVQLLITCVLISIFVFVKSLRKFAIENQSLYWIAFGLTMVCMIAMVCCESVRRKSPTNFIFLGIFTICEGFMLGSLAAHFEADAVLIAAGACVVVTLALTVFAFQSKYDFTNCGGMLLALLLILLLAGLLMAFLPQAKWAMIGYGSAGALIFSLYIVYDTQLMLGGKHKYALNPEEYIFAALNLYLDIINLFVYLLMIIGIAKSD